MKLKLECGSRTMAWLARALKTTSRFNSQGTLMIIVRDDLLLFRTPMRTFDSVDSWVSISLTDRDTNPYFSLIEVKSKKERNQICMEAKGKDLEESFSACCAFDQSQTRMSLIKNPEDSGTLQLEFRCSMDQFNYEKRVEIGLFEAAQDLIPGLNSETEVDFMFAGGLQRLLRHLTGTENVDLAVVADKCKTCMKGAGDQDSPQITDTALKCTHARKGGKPDLCDFVMRVMAETEIRALFKEVGLTAFAGNKKVEKRAVKANHLVMMLSTATSNLSDKLQLGFDGEGQVYLQAKSDDYAGFVLTCPALNEVT